MIRNAIILLVFAILLSSCVSWKTVAEKSESAAQVRFVTLELKDVGINNIDVDVFDNPKDACKSRPELSELKTWVAVLSGPAIDHGRKDLSMPLGEEFSSSSKTEIYVDGNKPLIYSIGFRFISGVTTTDGNPPAIAYLLSNTGACKISKIFTPKSGKFYEVTYQHNKDGCSSNVYEILRSEDGEYTRQPVNAEKNTAECK